MKMTMMTLLRRRRMVKMMLQKMSKKVEQRVSQHEKTHLVADYDYDSDDDDADDVADDDDDADDDDVADDDDADDDVDDDDASKDVQKVSGQQGSVRTTHAAADYQEFTAPHSAYSHSSLPTLLRTCQHSPTQPHHPTAQLPHILHTGTLLTLPRTAQNLPILPHILHTVHTAQNLPTLSNTASYPAYTFYIWQCNCPTFCIQSVPHCPKHFPIFWQCMEM